MLPHVYPHPQPSMPPFPGAKVRPEVLFVLTVWRLAVAACAFTGLSLYLRHSEAIKFFTQQSNLLVGVCFTGLALYPLFVGGRRHEPAVGWARGAVTVYIIVTGFVFATMMSGDYSRPEDLLSHLITPLLVTADWIFVGRDQATLRWWHPLAWLTFPVLYLVFYVTDGKVGPDEYLYEFLNPSEGSFPGTVAGFLAGFAGLGFALLGYGKLKAAMSASMQQANQQPNQPNWPQQMNQRGGPWMQPQPFPQHGFAPPQHQQPQFQQGFAPQHQHRHQQQPQFQPQYLQPVPPAQPHYQQPQMPPSPQMPPPQQPYQAPPGQQQPYPPAR